MDRFREWLSDNLRYILLVIAIFLVLVGLFFGVRAVMRSASSDSDENAARAVSSVDEAASDASETASAADHGILTENADADVSKLVSDYYTAVSDQDVEKVRTLVDTLPEEDAEEIESSGTTYSSVKVYTKNGLAAGSYVVYASYEYENEEQTTPLPGLAQMYVKKGSDGDWKIILGGLTEEEQAWITEVGQDDDVQALIKEIRDEYDAAVAAMEAAASAGESVSSEAESTAESAEEAAEVSGETSNTESTSVAEDEEAAETSEGGVEEEAEETYEEPEEEEYEPEETPEPTQAPEPTYRDTVILSTCYVRSGPGYEYEVLTEVRTGTPVTVIGDLDNGWWHVYADGVYGYVGKSFIE